MKKAIVAIGVVVFLGFMIGVALCESDKEIMANDLNSRQDKFREDYVVLSERYHMLLGREREASELAAREPIVEHWEELRDVHVEMYETALEAVETYEEYIGDLEDRLSELLDGDFIPSDVRFVH